MVGNIVISGATKGIGRAVAEKFAREGFSVVFCARHAEQVQAFEAYLKDTYNIPAFGMVADFSIKAEVEAFGTFCINKLGKVDALVNNAGVFIPGQVQSETEGTFETMMQVNVASAYYLTRRLLPGMIAARDGYIFNMCSTASFVPYVNGGSYCISKHALLGFSKVLREELKPHHIAVSTIMPGATLTNSWAGTELPVTRFMSPDNVASALWFAWENRQQCVMEEILLRPFEGDIG